MTNERTAELKDKILRFLADSTHSPSVRQISESTHIRFDTVFTLTDAISKDGYIHSIDTSSKDRPDKLLRIQPEGRHFLSVGGYFDAERREVIAHRKSRHRIALADIIKIGLAVFFGLLSFYLSWLKYSDDQTIAQKNKEIELLKHRIQQLEAQK